MTIERNVTVKLNVPKGREGKAFEDAARGAKKVAGETSKAEQAVKGMIMEMRKSAASEKDLMRITKQLTRMGVEAGRAKAAATQLVKQVGTNAKVSEQQVRQLGQAMRQLGTAGGGGRGFMGGGLAALGPLAGAGGLAFMSMELSTQLRKRYATPLDEQLWDMAGEGGIGDALTIGMRRTAHKATFGLARLSDDVRTEEARRAAHANVKRTEALKSKTGRDIEIRRLQREAAVQRLGVRDQLFTMRFQGATDVGALGMAGRDGAAVDDFRLGRARQFARGLLGGAQADLRDARTINVATGKGVNPQKEADAMNRIVAARREIIDIERRQLELVNRRSEARRQELMTLKDQAKTQEESYKAIAAAERQRVQGLRERFGGIDPMERRRLLEVSRTIAGGGRLTPAQEQAILQHRDFFGGRAGQILGGRADRGGFGELVRNLGIDEKGRQAQQRAQEAAKLQIQLENKIAAEINVNARNLAEAMAAEIEPQLKQLQADLAKQIQARLDRALHELAIQQNAVAGP